MGYITGHVLIEKYGTPMQAAREYWKNTLDQDEREAAEMRIPSVYLVLARIEMVEAKVDLLIAGLNAVARRGIAGGNVI